MLDASLAPYRHDPSVLRVIAWGVELVVKIIVLVPKSLPNVPHSARFDREPNASRRDTKLPTQPCLSPPVSSRKAANFGIDAT